MDECNDEGEQGEEDTEGGDDELDLIDRYLRIGGWLMLSAVRLTRVDLQRRDVGSVTLVCGRSHHLQ